jgi:ABC-2 type transport system permease protein
MSNLTWTIAKREWVSRFNSPVAYVFMIIFLVLMGFFTFNISRFYETGQADLSQSFFIWHPWLYLILIPAVSMGIWSEERRANTIEVLFTLPVTPMQAIVGKFLASWAFVALAIVLTFPIIWTTNYLGKPDGGVIFSGYLGTILLAGAYLSIGMFTSAMSKNQVISFIVAVVIGLFLILAGFPPVTDFLSDFLPANIVDGVAGFSFVSHFETLQRGIIDFRDLFYFGSVIAFMLFSTQVVLSNKASS